MNSPSLSQMIGAAALATVISVATLSTAFAEVPGEDEGRDAAIVAVQNNSQAALASRLNLPPQVPATAATSSATTTKTGG